MKNPAQTSTAHPERFQERCVTKTRFPAEIWSMILFKHAPVSLWLAFAQINKFFSLFISQHILLEPLNTLAIKFQPNNVTDQKAFTAWWHNLQTAYPELSADEKKQCIKFLFHLNPETLVQQLYTFDTLIPEHPTNLVYSQKRNNFFKNLKKFHHIMPQYYLDDIFRVLDALLSSFDLKKLANLMEEKLNFSITPLNQSTLSWLADRETLGILTFSAEKLLPKLFQVKHFEQFYLALLCQQPALTFNRIIEEVPLAERNYFLIDRYYSCIRRMPYFSLATSCAADISVFNILYDQLKQHCPAYFSTDFDPTLVRNQLYSNQFFVAPPLQTAIGNNNVQQTGWFLEHTDATLLQQTHITVNLNVKDFKNQIEILVALRSYNVPFRINYETTTSVTPSLALQRFLRIFREPQNDHPTALLLWLVESGHIEHLTTILNKDSSALKKINNLSSLLEIPSVCSNATLMDFLAKHDVNMPRGIPSHNTMSRNKLIPDNSPALTALLMLSEHERVSIWSTKNEQGIYPIHSAAAAGNWEVLHAQKILIPNILFFVDTERNLPLHYAAMFCGTQNISSDQWQLLTNLETLNKPNAAGKTALICAAETANYFFVAALLNSEYLKHLDIDAVDHKGNTALHYAIAHEDIGITQLFIDVGANIYSRNSQTQQTPLLLASQNRDPKIAALLSPFHTIQKESCVTIAELTKKIADSLWPSWHSLAEKLLQLSLDQHQKQFTAPETVAKNLKNFLHQLYYYCNSKSVENKNMSDNDADFLSQLEYYQAEIKNLQKLHSYRPWWLSPPLAAILALLTGGLTYGLTTLWLPSVIPHDSHYELYTSTIMTITAFACVVSYVLCYWGLPRYMQASRNATFASTQKLLNEIISEIIKIKTMEMEIVQDDAASALQHDPRHATHFSKKNDRENSPLLLHADQESTSDEELDEMPMTESMAAYKHPILQLVTVVKNADGDADYESQGIHLNSEKSDEETHAFIV